MHKLLVGSARWAVSLALALLPTAALAVGHGGPLLPPAHNGGAVEPKAAVTALDTSGQILFASGIPQFFGTEFFEIRPYSANPQAIDLGTFPDFIGQIAFNPANGRLYAVNLTGAIIEFATNLSSWTYLSQSPSGASFSFKFDIDGTAYAVGLADDDPNLYRLDPPSGNLTRIGDTGFLFAGGDLAFDTDGTLYASTGENSQLLRIDKHTGAAVLVGDLGVGSVFGLDIDVDGTIYGGIGSAINGAAALVTVNRAGGAARDLGVISGADGNFGLASISFSKRIQTSTPPGGGGGGGISLTFPLKGTTPNAMQGLDPYTAPILAVFDHQLSDASQRKRPFVPYACDRAVVAYTGERGDRQANAATCADHPGYAQRRGAFRVNGHYAGSAGGTGFLNADGSPGFDYMAAGLTQVYAAVSGTVHYPTAHIGLADPYNRHHLLEIIPDGAPGFRVYYTHLSTHPAGSETGTFVDPSPASGCPSSVALPLAEGTHVDAGCLIALSGDAGTADRTGRTHPQLHFEVHRVVPVASGKLPVSSPQRCVDEAAINDGGHACVPVDPYGWLPAAKDPYVPLTGVANTNLWAVAPH